MNQSTSAVPAAEVDSEFAQFWAAYPRKVKKGDAFKAWGQTRKIRPAITAILEAISRAKRSDAWRKAGGEFVPYPATWLRAWGWMDDHKVDLSEPCANDAAHGPATHLLGERMLCERCWTETMVRHSKAESKRSKFHSIEGGRA